MIHLSQNLMSHCFALSSQVHAWVESHQSTLSVLPTTASRWCCCCHPSWGTSICHWHHRYQIFSLICVPPGLFSTLLASHPKLKGWICSSQALQISLKEYIKNTDASRLRDYIWSYCLIFGKERGMVQNSILQFGFLGLCNKWSPSTKPHTMFPLTSPPGFTNGMALYHKKCLEPLEKKQNCPLQIGKCSARHQLTEHQTRMSEVINNLRQSFVWVGYIA